MYKDVQKTQMNLFWGILLCYGSGFGFVWDSCLSVWMSQFILLLAGPSHNNISYNNAFGYQPCTHTLREKAALKQ